MSVADFGPELAGLAYARGLSVTKADGSMTPIPIAATPAVLDAQQLQTRQRLAAHLSSAGLKMSRSALTSAKLRAMLVGGLSPLEAKLAEKGVAQLDTLATTRVDLFDGDRFSALAINATIPAMQGYSDIAAHTFLDVTGRFAGLRAARHENQDIRCCLSRTRKARQRQNDDDSYRPRAESDAHDLAARVVLLAVSHSWNERAA